MIAAIIQARMTSSRLPGKVMADVAGEPLLKKMLDRIGRAEGLDEVVVATTGNDDDDPVAELCSNLNISVHRGDEHDVLERFFDAASSVEADTVVRLTADCPMIDPGVLDDAIETFESGKFDYVSNVVNRTYPDGLDVEVFSFTALQEARNKATLPFHREHVTPYLNGVRNDIPTGSFDRGELVYPADFSHVRWTVDYPEDLERVRHFFSVLPANFTWLQALSLATREPELLGLPPESYS
jgi:spore coat polysaccharide biosynthesis protein SpsF (cytidylyltransferase family)